ncbi:hypothetical protein B4Q13_20635 [Lacticaseibacillus rhamnosus]
MLFTCFPVVFSQLAITLHIPLTLMLFGIVLRGSAFVFRAHDPYHLVGQRRWGRIFSIASVVTPFLLGVSVGAVASGRVRQGQARLFAAGVLADEPDVLGVDIDAVAALELDRQHLALLAVGIFLVRIGDPWAPGFVAFATLYFASLEWVKAYSTVLFAAGMLL